jgi:hypothetical protein
VVLRVPGRLFPALILLVSSTAGAAPRKKAKQPAPHVLDDDPWARPAAGAPSPPDPPAGEAPAARAPSADAEAEAGVEAAPQLPLERQPVAALSVGLGLAGRSFDIDADLQSERAFPRPAVVVGAELFPLRPLPAAWRPLGLGGWYQRDFGKAVLAQTEATVVQRSVAQTRFALEVRYAFRPHARLAVLAALGAGRVLYAVDGAPLAHPSQCRADSLDICLPRVALLHARAGADARLALDALRIDLRARGLPGLALDGAAGDLAAEGHVRSWGLEGGLGASFALLPWLAVRADLDTAWIRHGFVVADAPYEAARELYYTARVGVEATLAP